MPKQTQKIKIEFPEYWEEFTKLVAAADNASTALRLAWTDLHEHFTAKAKQSKINKANASKPRGQRVPDSEASARTLARRKAKAA